MKLIFQQAQTAPSAVEGPIEGPAAQARHIRQTHPYTQDIYLDPSQTGWYFQGRVCPSTEHWISTATKACLAYKIDDCAYEILPNTGTKKSRLHLRFYFKNEIDRLEFRTLALPNADYKLTKEILSTTATLSHVREQRLRSFITENDLGILIYRPNIKTFSVTCLNQYDALAFLKHFAAGDFDKPIDLELSRPANRNTAARLLTPPSPEQ